MSTRFVRPVGRREPFRFKQGSLTAKRDAYMKAGEPYGGNRKGLKRWLRDVIWICACGQAATSRLHCRSCGAEPPGGCSCSWCSDQDDDGGM